MRFNISPINARPAALGETAWYEYAVRFLFGGLITALAGVIAKKYGGGVGGIFLAFPAIFPASATLIEKHERMRKAEKGLHGIRRARRAVGADAAGAAMGSVGLIAFAVVTWQSLPNLPGALAIALSTLTWALVSAFIWIAWKRNWLPHRTAHRPFHQQHHSA